MQIELNDSLYKKIQSYCELNDIIDINQYINDLIQKEITIILYGSKPGYWKTKGEIKPLVPELFENIWKEIIKSQEDFMEGYLKNGGTLKKYKEYMDICMKNIQYNIPISDNIQNNEQKDNTEFETDISNNIIRTTSYDNNIELVEIESKQKRKRVLK